MQGCIYMRPSFAFTFSMLCKNCLSFAGINKIAAKKKNLNKVTK